MGKTETIKERAIYVYLPSVEQKERWEDGARKQGVSISKFVAEHVEDSLRQVDDSSYKSSAEMLREARELREQFERVGKEKRVLEIALDRLEEELRRYRAQPFLDEDFTGVRRYQLELVGLLRYSTVISSEELLSRLRINPSEPEAVKAVSKQLENLEAYGLVKSSPKGWRWVK
ncbi:MAG: hypothetical protein V1850_01945 [Candidatus Bathyarchaeota archaeon]